ncbi:YdbH domain-containing protein [Paraglaciecola sp. 2405UD69-4]|uniref:intermembrane phospholipid transport protein YdbH family protein n=1 Tax=Paraglaciecola sp. 2405UD69-4 TaxID=3391836 RepID=UPI0039C94475
MTRLFKRPLFFKIFNAVLLLLVVLTLLFSFRRPIAINLIEHFASSNNVKIECLDFSVSWPMTIDIQQACATSPIGELQLQSLAWNLWTNELAIEQINISHKPSSEPDTSHVGVQQSGALELPNSLPKFNISNIQLESYLLEQPINLRVQSSSYSTLNISGDLTAEIEFTPKHVSASLTWYLSDPVKFISEAQSWNQKIATALKNEDLGKSEINTQLSYDGYKLLTESNVNIKAPIAQEHCPVELAIEGKIAADLNLDNNQVNTDLSQLSSTVSLLNCQWLKNYLVADDVPKLAIHLPNTISLDATKITVPKLEVTDLQNKDNQNIYRIMTIKDLSYDFNGKLELSYNTVLKQPIKNKQLSAEQLKLSGRATIKALPVAPNNQHLDHRLSIKVTDDNHLITVTNFEQDSLNIEEITSKFKFSQTAIDNNSLRLGIDSHISKLKFADQSIGDFHNQLDVAIMNFDVFNVTGHSSINDLSVQNIKFQPIKITHSSQGNLNNQIISSQHNLLLEDGFALKISQQQASAKLIVAPQEATTLATIFTQIDQSLVINHGELSAKLDLALPLEGQDPTVSGQVATTELSFKYQDYQVNNINYQSPITYNSAGLQLPKSTLNIDEIDVGVISSDIVASLGAINGELALHNLTGKLFEGQFLLPKLWLDGRDQNFNVELTNIELSEVVALQQQPGINITGRVNGDLPIRLTQEGISIDEGWMASLEGGKLTIVNNPSFDSIKAQQPELALLENLDFTQLSSNVKFTPDGWVFFDIALKGNNPDKKQSVNFNYSHEENLFSLLESIRLVNSVGNSVEQKIKQGDKK